MKALKFIASILLAAATIDLLILMATVVQIIAGEPPPHIPFWDAQIAFLLKLFVP